MLMLLFRLLLLLLLLLCAGVEVTAQENEWSMVVASPPIVTRPMLSSGSDGKHVTEERM